MGALHPEAERSMRRGMASGQVQQAGERRTPEDWIRAALEDLVEAGEARG